MNLWTVRMRLFGDLCRTRIRHADFATPSAKTVLFRAIISLPAYWCSATFFPNLPAAGLRVRAWAGIASRDYIRQSSIKGRQQVLTQDCKVVWYAKLKIDDREIPVVYDPLLVPSINGCIYLYNLERDSIVQYTWNIVQKLLVDLDKNEKSTIKKAVDAKWKAAQKRFTKGQINTLSSEYTARIPAPVAPVREVVENRWDAIDDDSFELDDMA